MAHCGAGNKGRKQETARDQPTARPRIASHPPYNLHNKQELRRPDGPLGLEGLSLAQLATLLGEEPIVNAAAHRGAASATVSGGVTFGSTDTVTGGSGDGGDGAPGRGGSEGSQRRSNKTMFARLPLGGGRVPSFGTLLRRFGAAEAGDTDTSTTPAVVSTAPGPAAAVVAPPLPQEEGGGDETIFGMAKQGSRRHHGGSHGSLEALAREPEGGGEAGGPSYGTVGRGGKRAPALAAAVAAALQRLPAHGGGAQTLPLRPNHNEPHPALPPPHPRRRTRQQVVEGDGETHLLLLSGRAEPYGTMDDNAAPAQLPAGAVSAPPPAVVPHFKGRWALKRGSVGFLLSEARCQALAQQAAALAAAASTSSSSRGAPPLHPSLSSSTSWRGPSNMRHRRLASSLSVGSGTALAAAVAAKMGDGGDDDANVEAGVKRAV